MWRTLKFNGRGYTQATTSAGEEIKDEEDRGVKPLDPIDPSLVGALRIHLLLQTLPVHSALRQLRDKIREVLIEGKLEFQVGGSSSSSVCFSTRRDSFLLRRYKHHLGELRRSGIVKKERLKGKFKRTIFFNKYFSVPKNSAYDRAIFHGKKLSEKCEVPRKTNLQETQDLLRRIASKVKVGKLCIAYSDYRHFFHQIPIPKVWENRRGETAELFFVGGKQTKNGVDFGMRWTTLPMGWSLSPFLAQGVAFLILLFEELGDHPLWDLPLTLDSGCPPTHVDFHDGSGFVVITYDNVGFFGTNENTVRRAQSRLRRNAKIFHAIIKPGSEGLFTTNELRQDSTVCVFLGIRFALRQCGNRWEVMWRSSDDKLVNWEETIRIETTRDAARWLGRWLWCMRLTLKPLCFAKDLIPLARDVGIRVALHQSCNGLSLRDSWEKKLPGDQQREWTDRLNAIKLFIQPSTWNHLCQRHSTEPDDSMTVYTDASNIGYGIIVHWDKSKKTEVIQGTFPKEFQEVHIYIKEAFAFHMFFSWLRSRLDRSYTIRLFSDNSALVHNIQNGYSANRIVNDWLLEAYKLIVAFSLILTCGYIHTSLNPSDEPSRNSPVDEKKLESALLGVSTWVESTPFLAARFGGKRIRHSEVMEELDELVQELPQHYLGTE